MDPIIVLLLALVVALAFYIYHRGQVGVQTDIANARAESAAALDDLKTHVLEAKAHALAAIEPTTIVASGPAATTPPAAPPQA